jgi:hypothetical protein
MSYFETGTVGAEVTVANSGGTGNTAFDIVEKDTGAHITYTDIYTINGDRAVYVEVPAAANAWVGWQDAFGTRTRTYGRAYLHHLERPQANEKLIQFRNGTVTVCSIGMGTDGTIKVYNTSGTVVGTSAVALERAKKVRIEWDVTFSATVGAATIRIYNVLDSTTITSTLSVAASQNFGAQATSIRFGREAGTGQFAYTLDSLNVNTSGFPGPTPATYGGKPTSMTWEFENTGVHGGGQGNALIFSPTAEGVVIQACDVGGFQRSTDHGVTWLPINEALGTSGKGRAGAALGAGLEGNLFAVTGPNPGGAQFWRSTDDGATWTAMQEGTAAPHVDSQSGSPLPQWPRGVGRLIAVDDATATEYLYVGDRNRGVARSTNGGATWSHGWALSPAGTTTYYIRTIISDNAGTLFVGCFDAGGGGGVYKITNARGTPNVVKLGGANAPQGCEELFILENTLYAAVYGQGCRSIATSAGAGTAWTVRNSGLDTTGPKWHGLTGHVAADGTHTLFIGCHSASSNAGGEWDSVMRSRNGGATWQSIISDASKKTTMAGTDEVWWVIDETPGNPNIFGHNNYVCNQMETDPFDDQRVMVTGRQGAWGTADDGATWYPHMFGMPLTVDNGCYHDPSRHTGVLNTNSDHTVQGSSDNFFTLTFRMPTAFGPDGLGAGFDPYTRPAMIYVGHGGTGTANGNVDGQIHTHGDWFTNAANDNAASWTDTNLDLEAGGKRAVAIAVGRNASDQTVAVAVVDEYGMVRRVGTGAWARATNGLPADGIGVATSEQWYTGSMVWPLNSAFVYHLDRTSGGLHRSSDYGASWTRIWTVGDSSFPMGNRERSKHIAVDPFDDGLLYVSVENGVYKCTNAKTGTVGAGTLVPTDISPAGAARFGPCAVNKWGWLFVHCFQSDTVGVRLYMSQDKGVTWTRVDDDYYRNGNPTATRMAITENNHVYVSNEGCGMSHGVPVSAADPIAGQADGVSAVTGTITGMMALAGGADGFADVVGDLMLTGTEQDLIAAQADATSSGVGTLTTVSSPPVATVLEGTITGSSSGVGTLMGVSAQGTLKLRRTRSVPPP